MKAFEWTVRGGELKDYLWKGEMWDRVSGSQSTSKLSQWKRGVEGAYAHVLVLLVSWINRSTTIQPFKLGLYNTDIDGLGPICTSLKTTRLSGSLSGTPMKIRKPKALSSNFTNSHVNQLLVLHQPSMSLLLPQQWNRKEAELWKRFHQTSNQLMTTPTSECNLAYPQFRRPTRFTKSRTLIRSKSPPGLEWEEKWRLTNIKLHFI